MEITSKRGRRKFSDGGFLYVFDKTSSCNSKKFWRCDHTIEGQQRCKARIHTQDDVVIKKINEHCHGSSAAHVEAAVIKTSIKRRCEETMESTATIINHCASGISLGAKAALPNHTAMKKMIRRKRNQIDLAPPTPVSREELVIPEKYKVYASANNVEEQFLLSDSGPDPNRILIFGRKQNLKVSITTIIGYLSSKIIFSKKKYFSKI